MKLARLKNTPGNNRNETKFIRESLCTDNIIREFFISHVPLLNEKSYMFLVGNDT